MGKFAREIRKTSLYRYFAKIRAEEMLRTHPALIALVYHEISTPDSSPSGSIGTELTVKDFHNHIRWLKNRFPIVRLHEGIRKFRDRSLRETCVAITFDDGHIGLETLAYDILKQENVPATVFVNASYLDNKDFNWLFKVIILQERGYTQQVCQLFQTPQENLVPHLRLSTDRNVLGKMNELDELFQEVRKEDLPRYYISKDFLRQDEGKLLDIGNHGYRHIKFSWLTYQEQIQELQKNIEAIKDCPNLVPLFALPYGAPGDWNEDTLLACQSLGYELLTAYGGINLLLRQYPDIRRFGGAKNPILSKFFYTYCLKATTELAPDIYRLNIT